MAYPYLRILLLAAILLLPTVQYNAQSSNIFSFAFGKKAAASPLTANTTTMPPAITFITSLMEQCLTTELGGKKAFNHVLAMGHKAQKSVSAACDNNNNRKAHQILQYYARTTEGRAIFKCAKKLQAVVQNPTVQNILGKYKHTANAIISGKVPSKICM